MIKARHDERAALLATDARSVRGRLGHQLHRVGQVRLEHADPDEVWELLEEAWRMTATKRAIRAYEGTRGH